MHALVVSFWLRGMSDADYRALCAEIKPAVDEAPDLVSALWTANAESGTYGGVFQWRDRQAMERFQRSTLYRALETHPCLADFDAEDFEVLDGTAAPHPPQLALA